MAATKRHAPIPPAHLYDAGWVCDIQRNAMLAWHRPRNLRSLPVALTGRRYAERHGGGEDGKTIPGELLAWMELAQSHITLLDAALASVVPDLLVPQVYNFRDGGLGLVVLLGGGYPWTLYPTRLTRHGSRTTWVVKPPGQHEPFTISHEAVAGILAILASFQSATWQEASTERVLAALTTARGERKEAA